MKTTVTVAKFFLYPEEEPTGYAVGFVIEVNNKSFYVDTLVDFSLTHEKTDEEICKIGYSQLKESIDLRVSEIESKPAVLGKELVIEE